MERWYRRHLSPSFHPHFLNWHKLLPVLCMLVPPTMNFMVFFCGGGSLGERFGDNHIQRRKDTLPI